eukprot:GCRY01003027.1.p1 GENE.GCRY01003027.1~~GCRY01003027.1.p1  ORF type:complete len:457 (+),score=53.41 GCRY01003027.1:111-1373(+)
MALGGPHFFKVTTAILAIYCIFLTHKLLIVDDDIEKFTEIAQGSQVSWVTEFMYSDIVWSWVNGSDPDYYNVRWQYCPVLNSALSIEKCAGRVTGDCERRTRGCILGSRDRDNDELLFSLRAYQKHMPWHKGRVILVTPNQTPEWLNTSNPRVLVYNQDDLFPDKNDTPTFSSSAMSQWLHRIPNLTNYFMYMNDDYMLGRDVKITDLMAGPDQPVIHQQRGSVLNKSPQHLKKLRTNAWYGSVNTSLGHVLEVYPKCDVDHKYIQHVPHVFSKRAFEEMHAIWPETFKFTSKFKFRNHKAIDIVHMHAFYLMCSSEKNHPKYKALIPNNKEYVQFVIAKDEVKEHDEKGANGKIKHVPSDVDTMKKRFDGIRRDRPTFYTINDGGFSKASPVAGMFHALLEDMHGEPSEFEILGMYSWQ